MAYLFLVITIVMMIGANADPNFPNYNNNNNNPFQGFPFVPFPTFPNFPNIPTPTFPPFPQFPQFRPIIPTFPTINIPSPDDIINKTPKPGEQFSGILVQSSNDGTTVITNENGVIKEYKGGKNPTVIKTSNVETPFKNPKITIEKVKSPEVHFSELPKIELPKLPDIEIPGILDFKGIQLPTIDLSQLPNIPSSEYTEIKISEIPVMPPLSLFLPQTQFTTIDTENIQAGINQGYIGTSSSSFSISSNVNGKKNYAGASKSILNNNGQIDERSVIVGHNDV